MAADSRITLTRQTPQGQASVTYDNARKVMKFAKPHQFLGVVNYGIGDIDQRSTHSFAPEFESTLPSSRITVEEFANELHEFYMRQWTKVMPPDYKGPPMAFIVGGFNDLEPYGRIFLIEIPYFKKPQEQFPNAFGINWGGQRNVIDRLIKGYDIKILDIANKTLNLSPDQRESFAKALKPLEMHIPYTFLPLQDCIDLAILFIRTTIEAQRLAADERGCGGPIDIATITRLDGFNYVQEKTIKGERQAF